MQSFEGKISKWDIVVLPFPYVDINTNKRRPALVVSSDEFNETTGLLWVLMITTSTSSWAHDVSIKNLKLTNLPAPSKIRCAKLATVEKDRVVRIAGSLSSQDINAVKAVLGKNLSW